MSAALVVALTNAGGMVLIRCAWSVVYAPTIPLLWAMFADRPILEWKTSAAPLASSLRPSALLKVGCGLGRFPGWRARAGYAANQSDHRPRGIGCSRFVGGCLVCARSCLAISLNQRLTHRIADELAERRRGFSPDIA